MNAQPAVHSTFALKRLYPVPVRKLFRAFSDPSLKERWHGTAPTHTLEEFTLDFQNGGIERFVYILNENSPFPGARLLNVSQFHDIVPGQRIVQAQSMSMNGNNFSSALITFEFTANGELSELFLTHQGAFFENSDGPEMRERGWGTLLTRLGQQLAV